ncbi:MAG: hypothetical protein ACP5I8_08040 [Phycisphaerae bacterium]
MAISDIREKINENQRPFVIGGIVMVCLAVGLLIWEFKPVSAPSAPDRYYFYDTSNGSITTEPSTAISPLKGAGGKDTLVQAFFFTCSTCGDKKIGYLLKYTRRARAAKAYLAHSQSGTISPQQSMQFNSVLSKYQVAIAMGTLVRLPTKGSRWYPIAGPTGSEITSPPRCSATGLAKPCFP